MATRITCIDVETCETGYNYISIQRETYSDGSTVWFLCNDWTGDSVDYDVTAPTAEQIRRFRDESMS